MPLDPNIYQQMQPNLASQLAGSLNQFTEQRARLSDLAQQREFQQSQMARQNQLQDFQVRGLQREEAAYPVRMNIEAQGRAEKAKQDIALGVYGGLTNNKSQEEINTWVSQKSAEYGLTKDQVSELLQPLNSGQDMAKTAEFYRQQAGGRKLFEQEQEATLKSKAQDNPFAKIDPSKYTPESLMSFAQTKDYTKLSPIEKAGGEGSSFAKVSPEKFTQQSIAKFAQTGDYSVLQPRKEEEAPAVAKKRIQDIEMKLADDYRTESKGWAETSTSMRKALGAIDNADKNPGSALAAGTAFMKILDPNSVVRETELGMALNASGWFDRAGNITEKLQSGVVMTKMQQKQLKAAALDLFEEAKKAQLEIDQSYEGRAKEYGANPKNIITQRGQLLPDTRKKEPVNTGLRPQDNEAITWAKSNPTDPRAMAILKANGVQ